MTEREGKIAIILNAGSGNRPHEESGETIAELFRSAGRAVELTLTHSPDEIIASVERAVAAGAAAIVAGGGDGTVNCVVAASRGSDIPLGILPLGTLNHFAKDLGIPLELEAAVRVILDGRTTRVDLGEVNGHCFLNNASLGLYPRVLQMRARFPAKGVGKWIVAAWATLRVLRHNPQLVLQLSVDGEVVTRRTPLVMIGNNGYRMNGLDAGVRDSLADGELAIYVVRATGRGALLRLLWRLLRRGEAADALEVLRAVQVTVRPRHPEEPVAFDGEVAVLQAPLEFRLRPLALRVLAPAREG